MGRWWGHVAYSVLRGEQDGVQKEEEMTRNFRVRVLPSTRLPCAD